MTGKFNEQKLTNGEAAATHFLITPTRIHCCLIASRRLGAAHSREGIALCSAQLS